MTTEPPVVLVVDDDPSIRASIDRLLRAAGHRVTTFSSTKHLLAHGCCHGPCCLVLDVLLPDGDGLGFFEELNRAGIHVPTIFITGCGDIPMSVRAIKAGAVDFLPKPFSPSQLLACVTAALDRSSRSLAHEHHLAEVLLRYDTLTQREREVFAGVASGMLNKQVASRFGISEKTIKVHRGRVMEKMNVMSFAELVRMADLLSLDANRRAELPLASV